ncbi:Inner membrane protein ydcZ [Raoultella terrigena]|uniref:Inner membrane protein ydcZ n=1 Tax=Raoultella terrigena TaxID=577 RepID=A0A3P8M3N1_RAOTE|nr:Inner membrane protein ydcZ [Raoultella terrigena]
MNQSLTLACLIAAGIGLVVQNTLMVRITQSASTILIAMLLNSLVGIVIFVTILLLRHGAAGMHELAVSVKWWTLIPGLLGSFFVFASISGYQKRRRGDHHCGAHRQPAGRWPDHRFSARPRRAVSRAGGAVLRSGHAGDRRLAGGQTPVLTRISEDRATPGQLLTPPFLLLLVLASVMSNGGT